MKGFGCGTPRFNSPRCKNAARGRSTRFEQLEERALLSAVGVATIVPVAQEGSVSEIGAWRVERDGSLDSPVVVPFNLSGSASWGDDYLLYDSVSNSEIALTVDYDSDANRYEYYGVLDLPVGVAYLDLELRANADRRQETTENARITLVPPNELDLIGDGCASIDIIDADSWLVQIETVDNIASEDTTAGNNASFVVTRTATNASDRALVVKFELSGQADPFADYSLVDSNGLNVALSRRDAESNYVGHILIPAGQDSASFELRPVNDAIREAPESVVVNLSADSALEFYNVGQNSAASATILDNDSWTIDVTVLDSIGAETSVGETPDTIAFRIGRYGESDLSHATAVWFGLGGSANSSDVCFGSNCRYDSLSGLWSTTIPAGVNYVDLTIDAINDSLCESTETLVLYLVEKTDYTLGSERYAAAQILDSDSWIIEVEAVLTEGSETGNGETTAPIAFTFSRSGGGNLAGATTVYYELDGTALPGT